MNRQDFSELLTELYEIHEKKQQDYGSSINYFPFGEVSFAQMLHVKSQRIVSLVQQAANDLGTKPNYESIGDSVKDMIIYGLMFLEYLNNE